jgi:hypothetical protein
VPYNFSKMTKIGEVWVGFVVAASNPSGIAWEHYQTMGEVEAFGSDTVSQSGGCCVPGVAAADKTCCVPDTL